MFSVPANLSSYCKRLHALRDLLRHVAEALQQKLQRGLHDARVLRDEQLADLAEGDVEDADLLQVGLGSERMKARHTLQGD